jgi:type IV pilus assembly protein PilN
MARINLLPWREERRKLREREFYVLLGGAAIVAIVLAMGIVMYFSGQISGQDDRNAFLDTKIKELEKKEAEIKDLDKTKAKLIQRKQAIEELQSGRSQMVHLFDDLVRTIPDGVRLGSIKQTGEQLTLEGLAESNARVSTYMRNLETSKWVVSPSLGGVEASGTDKRNRYKFTLKVNLKKPTAEGDPAAAAAAASDTPAPGAPK